MSILKRKLARRWIVRGDKARDSRDWNSAVLAYRGALRTRPELVHIWIQYGHMLKEVGYLADAELAYRQALTRDRLNGDAFLQLGHVLKLQARLPEALDAYRLAYIVDPDLREVWEELRLQQVDCKAILALPKKFI